MAGDVHEDRAAVVVRVAFVELGESSGEVVGKDLVRNGDGGASRRRDAPGLVVNTRYYTSGFAGTGRGRRAGAIEGAKFLNVFGEVKDSVATRRPLGHLKLKRFFFRGVREFDLDRHLEQVRRRARHRQPVSDRFEGRLLGCRRAAGNKDKDYRRE